MSFVPDMEMAVNPGTADLAYMRCLIPSPDGEAEAKRNGMDEVAALAVKRGGQVASGDEDVHESPQPGKRKIGAPGVHSNERVTHMLLLLCATGSGADVAKEDHFACLGLSKPMRALDETLRDLATTEKVCTEHDSCAIWRRGP